MSARPASGREPLSCTPALRLAACDDEPGPAAARADPDRPLALAPATVADQQSFETGIPNVARIYDALLGGKENYAADREAARALTAAIPGAARAARDNRAFLGRAVRYLAEAGINQFLDIGAGLPAQGAVHEIAREACPGARVVYVDNDEVVVSHARALLARDPGVLAVEGDLRYPRELLCRREVREHLDFTQPVAVLLVGVLHFLGDSESPWQAVSAITARIAPGSYVVVSHVAGDEISAQAVRRARDIYASALVQGTARRRAEILRFFSGLDLVQPGLVDVTDWPSDHGAHADRPVLFWAGAGRKPGTRDRLS